MLTKATALELAPFGVRCNCVAPGTVDTNMYRYSGLSELENDALIVRAAKHHPLGRVAQPEEIAKAIIYLTSEKADFITGHVMKVDGGRSLTSAGYTPWYGNDAMDRRYEPTNGVVSKAKGFYSNYFEKKVKGEVGSDRWVRGM